MVDFCGGKVGPSCFRIFEGGHDDGGGGTKILTRKWICDHGEGLECQLSHMDGITPNQSQCQESPSFIFGSTN